MRCSCSLLLMTLACGPATRGQAERVHAGDVLLHCPPQGPVTVDVAPASVVSTWQCDGDGQRCVPVPHVLDGTKVEVPCRANTGQPRRVRWVAPVR